MKQQWGKQSANEATPHSDGDICRDILRGPDGFGLDGQPVQPHDPAAAIALGIGYLPEERRLQGIFASKALENNLISNMLQRFTGRLGRLDFAGLGREARRVIDVRTKTEIHGFIRALAERAVRWR